MPAYSVSREYYTGLLYMCDCCTEIREPISRPISRSCFTSSLFYQFLVNFHCAFFRFYHVFFFYQTGKAPLRATSGSRSHSHTVLVVSQQTSHRSLRAICAFTVFFSSTWNAQSSKFWQQIPLPVLLAVADY